MFLQETGSNVLFFKKKKKDYNKQNCKIFFFLLWTFFLKMNPRTYITKYVSHYTARFRSCIFKYFGVSTYVYRQKRQVVFMMADWHVDTFVLIVNFFSVKWQTVSSPEIQLSEGEWGLAVTRLLTLSTSLRKRVALKRHGTHHLLILTRIWRASSITF